MANLAIFYGKIWQFLWQNLTKFRISNGNFLRCQDGCESCHCKKEKRGGGIAQLVERATPCEEVPCSIPAVAAGSLLVGLVSVSRECDRLRQKSWSPSSVSCVAACMIVRRSVLRPVRDITL